MLLVLVKASCDYLISVINWVVGQQNQELVFRAANYPATYSYCHALGSSSANQDGTYILQVCP